MPGSCGCIPTFPHHRDAVCKVLNCKPEREEVQAALMQWDGEAFETAAYAGGCVVALMRPHDEWSATPHARALAELPLISITKIGEAAPKPWPRGERPLAGIRVLDLSRVIAGPVAGRTLAAHGADVLLISGPGLPAIPWLTIDTGRGKLTSFVELKSEQGRGVLRDLLAVADIFSQGYRPRAIAGLGFSPDDAARINPGIIYVTLSAYGHAGPWAERRGFDSLVQTATGFNHAEGQAAGVDGPKELPAQMLDHATGYFMAFGAMMAKARQAREGGSWHVQVSLAQTGRWLWNLGRVADGLASEDLKGEAVRPFIEESRFGLWCAAVGQTFGASVENPGVLGPPGDAARQPSAAMAAAGVGIFPAFEAASPNFNLSRSRHLHFLGCAERQMGTISAGETNCRSDSGPVC